MGDVSQGRPEAIRPIERSNRRFRQEVLDAWLPNAVSEVQAAAADWLADCTGLRPRDALGSAPPAIFGPGVSNQEGGTSGPST